MYYYFVYLILYLQYTYTIYVFTYIRISNNIELIIFSLYYILKKVLEIQKRFELNLKYYAVN